MRFKEIIETLVGPNSDKRATAIAAQYADTWRSGIRVGSFDTFLVRKNDSVYSVWEKETLVGYFQLTGNQFDNVWVDPEYRNKRIFSKMLWFCKTHLQISLIQLGNIHSSYSKEALRNLSRFKKTWRKGDQIIEYDPKTADQFYSYEEPTGWVLFLENRGDFSSWPKFSVPILDGQYCQNIRSEFDWQID